MNNEIFTDIPWYEWLYQVSNLGRIKSLPKIWNKFIWKILKWKNDKEWYLHVSLFRNKKQKTYKVHRLVMLVFEWDSDLDVNHKNWIKTDNRLENLEYCTRKDNINNSFNELWRKSSNLWKFWKDNHNSKKILQFTKDGLFIKEWYWAYEINRELWISYANINKVCNWKRKTAWGFVFKYIN